MTMSVKTNKSFAKRLKITKRGKVLKRKAGQDHFRAKQSRSEQLAKKGWGNFDVIKKSLDRFLPHT